MKKRTNKRRKSPAEWAKENIGMTTGKPQEYSTESAPYQQIMDRLEGRILCYGNLAARCRGGPKQYTKSQLEEAKAKAMQEARIIVWMHSDSPACSNCDCVMPNVPPDRCGMCGCPAEHQRASDTVVCRTTGEEITRVWDAHSESQRNAAETADEKPDSQAENDLAKPCRADD